MKFIFIYRISVYLCEKLNVMQTDNHFEKLQHQYEAQQYFENENSTGDVSKVDRYKPHNYDCGSYSHKYSHLAPETNDETDY